MITVIGRQNMMDRPEPGSRVYPPRAIMQRSIKQMRNSHVEIDLLFCMSKEILNK